MMNFAFFRKHPAAGVFLLSYLLFSLAVIGTEVSKIDVRFAFILQGLGTEPWSLFPRINHVPYADYFSPYFYIASLFTLGGRFVNLWSMSQPSILLGSFTLMMTFLTGENMKRSAGWWAVLILLSSFEYTYSICQFGIDLPVAALAVTMLYFLRKEPDRMRTVFFFAAGVILSIFFRGSLGLLVFGGAVAGWVLTEGNRKNILVYGMTGAFAAAIGTGLVIGFMFLEGGEALFRHFIDWQIGKRVRGGDFFYYFLDGFCSFVPGSFLVLAALIWKRKEVLQKPVLPLLGFLLLPVVILSIPEGKHLRYILPLMPAGALAGAWFLTGPLPREERFAPIILRWMQYLPLAVAAAVPILITLGCLIWPVQTLPWVNWTAALALSFLLWRKRKAFSGYLGIWEVLSGCLVLINCGYIIPLIGTAENSSLFVREAEGMRTGDTSIFEEDPDHEGLKYLLWVPVDKRDRVHFLKCGYRSKGTAYDRMYRREEAMQVLPGLTKNDIVIVKDGGRTRKFLKTAESLKLKFRRVRSGSLGHREYHVFRLD